MKNSYKSIRNELCQGLRINKEVSLNNGYHDGNIGLTFNVGKHWAEGKLFIHNCRSEPYHSCGELCRWQPGGQHLHCINCCIIQNLCINCLLFFTELSCQQKTLNYLMHTCTYPVLCMHYSIFTDYLLPDSTCCGFETNTCLKQAYTRFFKAIHHYISCHENKSNHLHRINFLFCRPGYGTRKRCTF